MKKRIVATFLILPIDSKEIGLKYNFVDTHYTQKDKCSAPLEQKLLLLTVDTAVL